MTYLLRGLVVALLLLANPVFAGITFDFPGAKTATPEELGLDPKYHKYQLLEQGRFEPGGTYWAWPHSQTYLEDKGLAPFTNTVQILRDTDALNKVLKLMGPNDYLDRMPEGKILWFPSLDTEPELVQQAFRGELVEGARAQFGVVVSDDGLVTSILGAEVLSSSTLTDAIGMALGAYTEETTEAIAAISGRLDQLEGQSGVTIADVKAVVISTLGEQNLVDQAELEAVEDSIAEALRGFDERLSQTETQVGDHEERLAAIEDRLGEGGDIVLEGEIQQLLMSTLQGMSNGELATVRELMGIPDGVLLTESGFPKYLSSVDETAQREILTAFGNWGVISEAGLAEAVTTILSDLPEEERSELRETLWEILGGSTAVAGGDGADSLLADLESALSDMGFNFDGDGNVIFEDAFSWRNPSFWWWLIGLTVAVLLLAVWVGRKAPKSALDETKEGSHAHKSKQSFKKINDTLGNEKTEGSLTHKAAEGLKAMVILGETDEDEGLQKEVKDVKSTAEEGRDLAIAAMQTAGSLRLLEDKDLSAVNEGKDTSVRATDGEQEYEIWFTKLAGNKLQPHYPREHGTSRQSPPIQYSSKEHLEALLSKAHSSGRLENCRVNQAAA